MVTSIDRVRELFCGVRGHDNLLQFQRNRMFLRCLSCGHQTPGWELNETPPTRISRRDTRRLTLVRPQLVNARRIA
jgi:hypothetical protein